MEQTAIGGWDTHAVVPPQRARAHIRFISEGLILGPMTAFVCAKTGKGHTVHCSGAMCMPCKASLLAGVIEGGTRREYLHQPHQGHGPCKAEPQTHSATKRDHSARLPVRSIVSAALHSPLICTPAWPSSGGAPRRVPAVIIATSTSSLSNARSRNAACTLSRSALTWTSGSRTILAHSG